jgi:hypothetical protein
MVYIYFRKSLHLDRIGLFNIKMQCYLDFNDTKDGIPEIDTHLTGQEIA